MARPMVNFLLRLDPELHDRCLVCCGQSGQNLTDWIRDVLELWVDGKEVAAPEPIAKPENSYRSAVRAIWPELQKAAAAHRKRWDRLTLKRLTLMACAVEQHGGNPQILLQAIQGAVKLWKADPAMIEAYLVPETLYRPSKLPKYLETYLEKNGHGPAPRPRPQQPLPALEPVASPEMRARGAALLAGLAAKMERRP